MKLVSPRHEQTAAHMADGYFRVRHRPVATLTSRIDHAIHKGKKKVFTIS